MTKKLRLKKTCYGCRAMGSDSLGIPLCSLGFQMGFNKARIQGLPSEPVPLEPCPKPRTHREWFDAEPKSKNSP